MTEIQSPKSLCLNGYSNGAPLIEPHSGQTDSPGTLHSKMLYMANFRKPQILVAIADGLSLMRTTAISATGYDSLANDKLTYDSLLNDRLTYKSNTRGKPEVVYWVVLEEPEPLTKDPLKELHK